jgi:hypothetical protein
MRSTVPSVGDTHCAGGRFASASAYWCHTSGLNASGITAAIDPAASPPTSTRHRPRAAASNASATQTR